jgi:sugar/nucleoside kinase (ribokinase family)
MKSHKILTLGSVYMDIYCTNFPFKAGFEVETQTVGSDYSVKPGGSAVIFSCVAGNLGLAPILIGKVGQDPIGTLVKNQLKEYKVDTQLISEKDKSTNLSVNFINKDGKNILTTAGTANQSLSAKDIVDNIYQQLEQCSYLYLGSYFKLKQLTSSYRNIISFAKQKGVKVVLDHGRVTNVVTQEQINSVKDILQEIDIYIPSKDEFLQVFGVDGIKKGLKKVRDLAPNTMTIVTDAENLAYGIDRDGSFFKTSSYQINPLNTVGAGDTFNAGFIKAQVDGKNFVDSMNFAHAVAAIKISQNHYPTLEEVEKFLNSVVPKNGTNI